MPLTVGTLLGPYQILAPLGAGGMGEVYRAHDARLGRDVAIKVLPQLLSASPDLRARFDREARTISQLNHPHICTLHDVGADGGIDYIVMELIDGETLATRLERGPLPVAPLIAIATQVAGALAEAHRLGLVHRDLKPGNLMLTHSGVKLLDFGLARPTEPRVETTLSQSPTVNQPLTAAGAMVGTFQYMSPEQLEGKDADARSDLFAFGCVLYEMATGRRPFTGRDAMTIMGSMLRDTPAPISRLNGAMPRALQSIVTRCLEKDPGQRYSSAAELVEALGGLQNWSRNEGLPELARIIDRILLLEEGQDSWNAFELAREIDKLAPGDPMLERLRPEFSYPISIVSDPPGAAASVCFYENPEGEWLALGHTPLKSVHYPRGLTRLRLELPGYRTQNDLIWNLGKALTNAMDPETATWSYSLRAPGTLPDEMEFIPGSTLSLSFPGLEHLEAETTGDILMDRDPVTNHEYKRFVDDGGYARAALWREPFLEDRVMPFAEALTHFVDSVGRPGPARWEMGEYPAGEDDHPVGGISWFEAAAYAEWAGKSLPTIYHWNHVAATPTGSQIAPLANFAGRGSQPIGSTRSMNRFGVRDLAGNVREWVWNRVNRTGQRTILGGGWNDQEFAFIDVYAQPAFDRSPSNGFRCIRSITPDPDSVRLRRPIDLPFRDFMSERPVSDEVFGYFLRQFHYDKRPLGAVVSAQAPSPYGLWQTIDFDAAYGGERMMAHLILPTRGRAPFQTVVVFPGSLALHARAFNLSEIRRLDFLSRSGRAVLLPVYKSTYERGDEMRSDYPEATAFYKDHVIMWGKDLARAIDYVETRDDLDSGRIAYYGVSWGGALGAILPAVEPRIKVNILYVAGLTFQHALPEAEQINYITRVKQPTLMLNGELDFFFPAETSQRPMFELLGTPAEHKQRLTYPRGHTVPKTDLIKESLAWLDRYLGPVE